MMAGPAVRLRRAAQAEPTVPATPAAGLAVRMPPALSLDLLAAVLASGASPQSAVLALAHALEQAGEPGEDLIRSAQRLLDGRPSIPAELDRDSGDALSHAIGTAFSLSRRSGLPPAELLKAAAARERSRASMQARATIRRLEVLLIIPAGICLLPAFVVLGVAPVVIALFGR